MSLITEGGVDHLLRYELCELEILLRDALSSVDDQHNDVRALDCRKRSLHAQDLRAPARRPRRCLSRVAIDESQTNRIRTDSLALPQRGSLSIETLNPKP